MWLGVRLQRVGMSPAQGLVSCCEDKTQGKGEWLEAAGARAEVSLCGTVP